MLNYPYLVCLLLLCMMFDQLSMVPAAFSTLLCTKDVRTFANMAVLKWCYYLSLKRNEEVVSQNGTKL